MLTLWFTVLLNPNLTEEQVGTISDIMLWLTTALVPHTLFFGDAESE